MPSVNQQARRLSKAHKASSFALALERFGERARERTGEVVDDLAVEVYANLTAEPGSTPGATPRKTGRAAAAWKLSLNTQSRELPLEGRDSYRPEPPETARRRLAGARVGDKRICSNRAPHILKLEFGSSKQAPNGMLRVTMEKVRAERQ